MSCGKTHYSSCPTCRKVLRYKRMEEIEFFPFCSERCRWVDLGKWMQGEYRIPSEETLESEGEEAESPKENEKKS